MLTPPSATRNEPLRPVELRLAMATATLGAGAAIYVLFRSTGLRWADWGRAMGLAGAIDVARGHARPAAAVVPQWFVYSLPDGLWLLSLLIALDAIWSAGRARWVVRGIVLTAAVAHEVAQASWSGLGTSSGADVACYVAAVVAAAGVSRFGFLERSRR
jgi:hypothetical protein